MKSLIYGFDKNTECIMMFMSYRFRPGGGRLEKKLKDMKKQTLYRQNRKLNKKMLDEWTATASIFAESNWQTNLSIIYLTLIFLCPWPRPHGHHLSIPLNLFFPSIPGNEVTTMASLFFIPRRWESLAAKTGILRKPVPLILVSGKEGGWRS